jgi:hypothetical protein
MVPSGRRRTMDASPAFMEYRSVKKGSRHKPETFWVRNRGKKHASVGVFSEKEGLALLRIRGSLKNLGKGEKRRFLLRDKKPGMRDTAKTLVGRMKKKQIHVYTTPFLTTVSLSRDGNFFFLSGVRERNICLFSPTRPLRQRETPGEKEKIEKVVSVRPFSSGARTLSLLCVCVCVCVCVRAPCCSGF